MGKPIVDAIRAAGVVGAGGAGLPTHVKADAAAQTVLVNGASCEPLLMSDPYLMETQVDTLVRGLEAMMDCTGAGRGIIYLKGKHAHAMQSVREGVARLGKGRIEAFELGDFYPAGDEQVMVYEVLGGIVPERGIPLQIGAVVSNVESLCNVAHALDGKPVTHRYLTVGCEVRKPMVVRVPVGTRVAEVLQFAGGPTIDEYRVVDGGPMMGRVLPDTDQPVTKTTSGLLVLPPDHNVVCRKVMDPHTVKRLTNTICCQCSQCTDLCPRQLLGHSLHPHRLMRVLDGQAVDSPIAREALLCSECGICEKFACPMGLSPREVNAQLKKELMAAGVKWENRGEPLVASRFRDDRRIPTSRLVSRLGLAGYEAHPHFAGDYTPSEVRIPLRQHIGAPALAVVHAGDHVKTGDLIGEIPEGAMGARVHASIDGVVTAVENGIITIKA